ncbi:MAG: hypothetical protein JXA57_02350 [Armatimonadetes bacterium]|nr:hypothetical protein [Armatimonadota bacterium]
MKTGIIFLCICAVGCQVTPKEQEEAKRLLAEASQRKREADAEAARIVARAEGQATEIVDQAKRQSESIVTQAQSSARQEESDAKEKAVETREAADAEAKVIRQTALDQASAIIQEAKDSAAKEAEKEASRIIDDGKNRAEQVVAEAEENAEAILSKARADAKSSLDKAAASVDGLVAALTQAVVDEVQEATPESATERIEEIIAARVEAVRQNFSRVIPDLERDRRVIDEAIEKAQRENEQLAGGLVKTLIEVRLQVFFLTRSLLDQRLQALKSGGRLTVIAPAARPEPQLAEDLLSEIAKTDQEVAAGKAESERYAGGLVKSMIDARVATAQLTRSMLHQSYLASKYGLHVPPIRASSDVAENAKREEKKAENLKPSPIVIELVRKGFQKHDYRLDIPEDQITFTFSFTNQLPKDVRAFTGTVVFTDLFDRVLYSVNLTYNDVIGAGKSATWVGAVDYNQFDGDLRRLRNAEPKDLKVSFVLEKVVYPDGTKEEFESQ